MHIPGQLRLLFAALGVLVVACCVGVIAAGFFSVRIDGSSMEPTLHDGDRVFVGSIDSTDDLPRNSIVITRYRVDGPMVAKRVIALPGDRIKIAKVGAAPGLVSVQPGGTGPWQIVDNPAWDGRWGKVAGNCCTSGGKTSNTEAAQIVPAGMVFLLGDNIGSSDDSRAHGWVPSNLVKGTAATRLFPIGSVGAISDVVILRPAP